MPKRSSILYTVFSIKEKNTKYPPKARLARGGKILDTRYKKSEGFGLIEILLSVVLIIAIVTALFASSGTFLIRRGSDLQSIASKIASKDIESLRDQSFSSLPAAGTYTCVIVDTDLSNLGAGACGDRTVSNYTGDANIKQITVTIRWQQSGKSKSLVMDTLIYTNGL